MLATAGLLTILLILLVILKKWMSPLAALIIFPIIAAIVVGQASDLNTYIVSGLRNVAPTAAMFIFAIIFFGVMSEAGLFRPFVSLTLKLAGSSPPRIAIGTVALTSLVHLDGSGASTFLIAAPALVPVYDKIGMDRRVLAACIAMAAGVNNMLPWGGPTIRAATAIGTDVMALYRPIIPLHLFGLLIAFGLAYWLGCRERKRLATHGGIAEEVALATVPATADLRFFLNLTLTVAVIAVLVSGALHPAATFIIGCILALLLNFPDMDLQSKMIDKYAPSALMMASILFAAGVLTGILKGTGMLEAMAMTAATHVPTSLSAELPAVLGFLSMPMSFLFDPDSFYFGILPVLAHVGASAGITESQVAQGALLGQMTTGFPVSPLTPSTFLLIGLTRVGLAEHQKFTIPLLFLMSVSMTILGLLLGIL